MDLPNAVTYEREMQSLGYDLYFLIAHVVVDQASGALEHYGIFFFSLLNFFLCVTEQQQKTRRNIVEDKNKNLNEWKIITNNTNKEKTWVENI